ncbi:MAG: LysM peptidoglycan-binding domain-containing protein, partial [Candidatus Eisenbacteria bacterium]|nr:LysM peptidoglycan-binding domain-containing protein [Candidatus Eisenbacteria bacterium]
MKPVVRGGDARGCRPLGARRQGSHACPERGPRPASGRRPQRTAGVDLPRCNAFMRSPMVRSMSLLTRAAPILIAVLIAGCAHAPPPQDRPSSLAGASETPVDAGADSSRAQSRRATALGDAERLLDVLAVPIDTLESAPDISDSLAAATKARLPSVEELFDYPVVVNRRVLAWIDFYLGRGKATFNRSLERSGRYLRMARRIFAAEGVPQDLAFLAHVESGFRHNARSHARALGLWQFMRATARLYGLRCDSYVDERLDPEKETYAAARHLRDLHDRYDDWYLALAAYNAGAGKVNRAIRRTGSRDFWRIARTRYLRNETRNFVPAILAATILAKSPGAYGFTEETDPPLAYETVSVDSPTDLRVVARCAGAPLAEIQALNPSLLHLQTPRGTDAFAVHVPQGTAERFRGAFAQIPREQRLIFHRHRVRRGETLGGLARRYGASVRSIQNANGMGRRTTIYAGRTLKIPARDIEDWSWSDLAGGDAVQHRVRRGECLNGIAQRYGVPMRSLQAANGIADPSLIYPGNILTIPRPGPAAARKTGPADAGGRRMHSKRAEERGELRLNTSIDLGRVPSTAHIVADARQALEESEEESAEEGPRIHRVRRGDTLSGIAARYGVSLSRLCRWNGLARSSTIRPGQEIHLSEPDGKGGSARWHVVRRGESLWRIARRYGVRVADII